MTQAMPWKVVWITGASTGIGREMALQLATRGVTVAAFGRSANKLALLGPNIRPYPLEVTERTAVLATINSIERDLGPIDLAVLAAGTYTPVDLEKFAPPIFEVAMATNYLGVVNALAGLLPPMMSRRTGHVAWIASVAGYVGLPKAAAYGPSKAACHYYEAGTLSSLSAFLPVDPGYVEQGVDNAIPFITIFLSHVGPWRRPDDRFHHGPRCLVCTAGQTSVQPAELDICASLDCSLHSYRHRRLADVATQSRWMADETLVGTTPFKLPMVARVLFSPSDRSGTGRNPPAPLDHSRIYRHVLAAGSEGGMAVRALRGLGGVCHSVERFDLFFELSAEAMSASYFYTLPQTSGCKF